MTWGAGHGRQSAFFRRAVILVIGRMSFYPGQMLKQGLYLAAVASLLLWSQPAMALSPSGTTLTVMPLAITQGEQVEMVALTIIVNSSPGSIAIWDTDGNQYAVTTSVFNVNQNVFTVLSHISVTSLSVGQHTFYAVYSGDGTYASSTSSQQTVTVSAPPTAGAASPSTASTLGGVNVTLTGADLNTVASVTFGGTAATILSSSASQLVVKAPAHAAGAVDIVLSTAGGTLTTLAGAFTYGGVADPSHNAAVVALVGAQTQAVRQFASSHLSNFNQRLESLHGNGWAKSPFAVNLSPTTTSTNDAAATMGDTVNDSSSSLGSLRANMRKVGLQLAQARPAANDDSNLPDLPASTGPQRQALSWWIGGALDLGQQKGSSGGKMTTGGVSFGGDYRLNDQLTLGAGAGYSRSHFQSDDLGAKSIGQGVVGVLYASYRPTEHAYVDLVAGAGQLHFDLTRYIADDATNASGARGGLQTFGSLTAGYEWRSDQWLLSPYGRIDIARARLDSYTESSISSAALSYFKQNVRSDNASLGLRGEWRYRLATSTLVPQARLAYQRSLQGAGQASMQYADSSISNTVYTLVDTGSRSSQWLFSLGSKLLLDSGTMLSLIYSYGVNNDQYSAHSLQFAVTGSF